MLLQPHPNNSNPNLTSLTHRSFDSILTSLSELAALSLRTLHLEVRLRTIHSLATTLSPPSPTKSTPSYCLTHPVSDPDPSILALNAEMVAFDETTSHFLREREVAFLRTGLGGLMNSYLIANASRAAPMNMRGCGRMLLNVLVLQQNLRNIEAGGDLERVRVYFGLFEGGPDEVVKRAREDSELAARTSSPSEEETGEQGGAEGRRRAGDKKGGGGSRFTYDELKALLELCYSEQLADPERGVAAAARRQMADKLLGLSEYMWQS